VRSEGYQKTHNDKWSATPSFAVHDKVWISVPTAGKLQPRWEGDWKITAIKSPVTIQIHNGRNSKVVHSNRLRHQFQAAVNNSESPALRWNPPLVEHFVEETDESSQRYPSQE